MVWVFVRLKLALLRSGFAASPASTALYTLGTVFCVVAGLGMGYVLAVALGTGNELGTLLPVLAFIVVWLIWIMGPLLNSAQGDQTIDPGRLELLPLSAATQVRGLLISGLVGPAALGTLLGAVAGAFAEGISLPARLTVALCGVLLVFLCLGWSRAIGALFVGVLNSRRGRDLTIALSAVIAVGVYVISESINNTDPLTLTSTDVTGATQALAVLPPAALAQASIAATQGQWLVSVALLLWGTFGIGIALLIWQWALARRPDGGSGQKVVAINGSDVVTQDILYPAWVRWLPHNPIGATAAKELRYFFFRSTLQLQQLAIGTLVSLVLVAQTVFSGQSTGTATFIGVFVMFLVLWQSAPNTFGIDNAAVANYMLAGVGMRQVLLGKMLALLILVLPLGIIVQVGSAAVLDTWDTLPLSLALIPIPWLIWLGLGSQLSVRTAFPLIPGHKPNTAVAIGAVLGGLIGALIIGGLLLMMGLAVVSLTGFEWLGVLTAWLLGSLFAFLCYRNAAAHLEAQPEELLQSLQAGQS
ncbi:MAG: hypothetical protein K0U64_01315 [Actinomycetia bacterium]|nr:hypothetical protein [Actinomycetes bacterium]